MDFSPVIFWDVDYTKIDWVNSSRFVIGRVVRYGSVNDWINLKKTYGIDLIKQHVLNERDLDSRTLNFLSCVLNVPKEHFRCYKDLPSAPQHFSF